MNMFMGKLVKQKEYYYLYPRIQNPRRGRIQQA